MKVTNKDTILVNDKQIGEADKVRFWRYYKPIGLVTTDRDEKGRDTIYDHFPENMPRVMTVGRLDINSEGLLLLTNDVASSSFSRRAASCRALWRGSSRRAASWRGRKSISKMY